MISEQYADDVATCIANIPFDLINDKCYLWLAKTTLFVFALVIVNPAIFD